MRVAEQRINEAHSLANRVFDSSADAMVMFDTQGKVTSINRAAQNLYGWTETQAKGLVLPMIPEHRRGVVLKRLQYFTTQEPYINRDTRHISVTGTEVELNVTWSALSADGEPDAFLLVARDLTHVRKLETELLRLNEHLISLTNMSMCLSGSGGLRPTMESAVLDLMAQLKLSYCQVNSHIPDSGASLPTLRFVGELKPGEMDLITEVSVKANESQSAVQSGLVLALPIKVLDRMVGSMVVAFSNDAFLDQRMQVLYTFIQQIGSLLYAVSLLHTEREATEKLKELDRLRGDFVAMVSHELRTPLTCIKGFVDTLLRPGMSWSNDDQTEFLESIRVSSEQALKVVEDLLSVQQAEYGNLTIQRTPVDMSKIVEDACRRAQSISSNHAIMWNVPSSSLVVKGDATRLNQVMDNLLSNAIKYSPLGGDVVVKLVEKQEMVEVSVADSGIGVEPQHQEMIFEKFFRADNSAARRAEGLGLGLSIVKSIVSLHGGQVWLTSIPHKGSTFYFTLPY